MSAAVYRKLALLSSLLLPALALAAPEPCGVVTVGKSGTGAECSTPSLQDAIRLATDPTKCYLNEIWITDDLDNRYFNGGKLSIDDKQVKIVGGYTSTTGEGCRNLARTGRSTISGRGGDSESVIQIRGSSVVELEHLVIERGDDVNFDGGGIDFKGDGRLSLRHVSLVDNVAAYGGGMYVGGEGSGIVLNLLGNVTFVRNVAQRNGGGLHVRGNTRVYAQATGSQFVSNRALGAATANGYEDGYGGGLYLRHPAYATISGGDPTHWMFYDNSARYGGAIALRPTAMPFNGGVHMQLSAGSSAPLVLNANRASAAGAAIYLGVDGQQGNVASSSICLFDVELRQNVAPRGPAIFADVGDDATGDETQGNAYVNYCPATNFDSPVRCAARLGCSRFIANQAVDSDGDRTDGDIVEFPGSDGDFVAVNTIFENNYGGSVIRMGDDDHNRLDLANVLFAENDLGEAVVDSDASASLIRHATFADNLLAGAYVLRLVESGDSNAANRVELTNSLIDQPARVMVTHSGPRAQSIFRHVMASEIDSLVAIGAPRNPTHLVIDTDLRSADGYTPSPTSSAIDFGSPLRPNGVNDAIAIDRIGNPRSIDLPNRGSPGSADVRDLGAIERTSLDIRPDPVFRHDFE